MKSLGKYSGREVLWVDYSELLDGSMPSGDWICLTSCTTGFDETTFREWVSQAVGKGILVFWGQGAQGNSLHGAFDTAAVDIELAHDIEIDVATCGNNEDSLRDVFWNCFYAAALPAHTDYSRLTVVCTDLDGIDRSADLHEYMTAFQMEDQRDRLRQLD